MADLRFALEIAFNGTNYHGWQAQKSSVSVQEVLEKALFKLLRIPIAVMGCGRTDSGVHASQFFLHFDFNGEITEPFLFRLNQILPKDIAVYRLIEVSNDFHARFKATHRKYIYRVCLIKNPFAQDLALFVFKKPNIDLMNKACAELLHYRDFASFCKMGSDNKTTICKLMEAKWILNPTDNTLEFHVRADRFLRNMVRAMVGTLLEVGYGEIKVEDLQQIMESRNRSKAGKSVAARGLYLAEIGYNWDEYRR